MEITGQGFVLSYTSHNDLYHSFIIITLWIDPCTQFPQSLERIPCHEDKSFL